MTTTYPKENYWDKLLKDKSVIVNHSDIDQFVMAFKSLGLTPHFGANLGELGQVIYF